MIPPHSSSGSTTGSARKAWSPSPVLLEAAAGDNGLIVRLIEAFCRDTAARMDQVRRALAASNFPNIRAEAHTIKGSARQMGADEVAEACQELELACDLQEVSLVAARLSRVQALFDEIREAMDAYPHSEDGSR